MAEATTERNRKRTRGEGGNDGGLKLWLSRPSAPHGGLLGKKEKKLLLCHKVDEAQELRVAVQGLTVTARMRSRTRGAMRYSGCAEPLQARSARCSLRKRGNAGAWGLGLRRKCTECRVERRRVARIFFSHEYQIQDLERRDDAETLPSRGSKVDESSDSRVGHFN